MISRFPRVTIIPELDITEEKMPLVEMYYRTILPHNPSPFTLINLEDIRVLEKMLKTKIASFWNISRLMRYTGEHYGRNADITKILLIGNRFANLSTLLLINGKRYIG